MYNLNVDKLIWIIKYIEYSFYRKNLPHITCLEHKAVGSITTIPSSKEGWMSRGVPLKTPYNEDKN
jgi:hypothetical protein